MTKQNMIDTLQDEYLNNNPDKSQLYVGRDLIEEIIKLLDTPQSVEFIQDKT